MNTTDTPNSDDGFGKIVRDILIDYEAGDVERPAAVQAIIDAYAPRMRAAREHANEAVKAAAAYAAMDRAQHEIFKYVRSSIGTLVMNNAAYVAHNEYLRKVRDAAQAMVAKADDHSEGMMDTGPLREALAGNTGHRNELPVPIGVTVDLRFSCGHFRRGDHEITLRFLGWSMVVNSRFSDSGLEPMFLRQDDLPITLRELAALDTYLLRLA